MVGLSSSHKYSTAQARSSVQAIVIGRSYFLLPLKELVRFFSDSFSRNHSRLFQLFYFQHSYLLHHIDLMKSMCSTRPALKYLRLIASACTVVIGVANGKL